MKIPPNAQEEVNQAFSRTARTARYNAWGIKPRNKSLAQMPTAMELATIGAALPGTSNDDDPQKICARALDLWFASIEAISIQNQCNEDFHNLTYRCLDAVKKRPAIPSPRDSQFPMWLDDVLKELFPKKDTAERALIYKAYKRHRLKVKNPEAEPTKNEVEAEWTDDRLIKFDREKFYNLATVLLPWHAHWKKESISSERRRAALSSHKARRKARPPRKKLREIVQALNADT